MQARKKLSIVLTMMMLLQLILPIWSEMNTVKAAGSGPLVISLSPAKGTSNVPTNSVFKATFDEIIKKSDLSKTIAIYRYSDNQPVGTFPMGDYRVTIANNVLTLDASGITLAMHTDYYIVLEAGAIANDSNNALNSAITDPSAWSFRTISSYESDPPKNTGVTSGLCSIGTNCSSTLVPITSPLEFTFNENVYLATDNLTLRSSTDNRDIAVNSLEMTGSGSSKITYKPLMPLTPSTTYTISIASTNIKDASGNNYAGGTWSFTTAASPLQLQDKTPTAGASNVNIAGGLNIVLNFDKAVQGDTDINSTKMIRVRKVSDNRVIFETKSNQNVQYSGNKATINIGYGLENKTSYYVTVDAGAFTQAGNPSAIYYGIHNATDWVFTTGHGVDTQAPYIVTTSPAYGSVTVGTNEKIVLTFNEIVYPNSGTIEIYEYNSNALYRSISVTSDRVTGGGSQTITIDPHKSSGTSEQAKSCSVATRYYVKMNNSAFIDMAGNQAINAPSAKAYNFQVSASASAPQIEQLSPSNSSTTVATTAQFKATFNKSVSIDNMNYSVNFIPVATGSTVVPAKLEIDPKNARTVIITPRAGEVLVKSTDYYINISGKSIMDSNGNYFAGILNQYQWSFKTLGADMTPPAISKAEVSGNVIRIVFNELLKEGLYPSVASFYATVGGNARNISSISIEGNVVSVKLVSSVKTNQKVLISYTKPSLDGQIQDLTGNQALSFANVAVTNGFTDNTPTVISSSYSGSTISLGLSEVLNTVSSLAYTQFSVTVQGKVHTINNITNSGSTLFINLNQALPANATVVVNYTAGFYPLIGVSSEKIASFTHTVGTATGGGSGSGSVSGVPTIQSITMSSNYLYLQYNEAIRSSSKPGRQQYAVLVNGRLLNVTAVTMDNSMITLTLDATPNATDIVTVSYFGTSSTILDNDYNPAGSFTNMSIGSTNNGSTEAVTVQGAVLKGNTLTLNFSGNLDANSVPTADSFLVRLSDNSRLINNITISGSQLVLKLSVQAKIGEIATISYFAQANTLKSAGGIAVSGFTNMAVANQTTVLDVLSDDYASADNGVLLKTSVSTRSNDTSPGGRNSTRYTIATEKLVTAVTTLANANMTTADIVFDIPTTENSAIVAYSIAALEAAKQKGNYTLVVNYGDLSYSVPLNSIDLKKAASQAGGNSYLRIAFEEGSTSATSSLETAINRSGATIVEGPFAYELTVVNGSASEKAVITGNIARTAKTTSNPTYGNTTAVFYDEGISAISAVPTTFSKSGNTTTITFKRPGNSAYAIVKNSKVFNDTSSHWAHSEITIMARKFVVEGHSTTSFNPKANITRGEFATYIAKGLGLSTNKTAAEKFKDVNSNTVMGGYIGAAVDAGIVAGISSTSFAPNSYITRQDMALMMIRAASYAGHSTTLSSSVDSVLAGYSDKSQLSSYAKQGVATAISLGIIGGTTTTTISPKKNASRAEGALMIMRLLKMTDSLQY